MSMLHMESHETHGDERLEAKTDASAILIGVDVHAEILPCWTKVSDLVSLREHHLQLKRRGLAEYICSYIMELSSTYRLKRMSLLQLYRFSSACDCVNPRIRRKVLISLCQSRCACLGP